MNNSNMSATATSKKMEEMEEMEEIDVINDKEKDVEEEEEEEMASNRSLANIGNTCYLNSAIQALRHIPLFVKFIKNDNESESETSWKKWIHTDRTESYTLLEETSALVKALSVPSHPGTTIIPRRFVTTFIQYGRKHSDAIGIGSQADAAEALQLVIDGIHTQLARHVSFSLQGNLTDRPPDVLQYIASLNSWNSFWSKEYSDVLNIFYGQTHTKLICKQCSTVSSSYEPWNMLKVSIPGSEGGIAPTLLECIADTFATEEIHDYECDNCKKKTIASKEHSISRFPPVLILVLKRFTNSGQKIRARISYDENNLDLSPWRSWTSLQSVGKSCYSMCATIEHMGSLRGGHYFMRGKDPITGEWFTYDDSRVNTSLIGGKASMDTYIHFLERKE